MILQVTIFISVAIYINYYLASIIVLFFFILIRFILKTYWEFILFFLLSF